MFSLMVFSNIPVYQGGNTPSALFSHEATAPFIEGWSDDLIPDEDQWNFNDLKDFS